MDKNKLENVLKNIDPEKLNQIKTLLDGKKMDDVISEINTSQKFLDFLFGVIT